jgi:hypothetical protein
MTLTTRRAAAVLSVLLGLIVLADTVAWWWVAGRIEAEAAAWQAARRAEGYSVATGAPSRAGWPLHAEVLLPGVTFATAGPGSATAITWRAEQLRLVYTPWRPWQVAAVLDGPQSLQLGLAPPVTVLAAHFDVLIPLDPAGQAAGVIAEAHDLSLPVGGGSLAAGSVRLQLQPQRGLLSVESLVLPVKTLPFGGAIASLELRARSTVPIPPGQDPAAALAAWHGAGGKLVIDDVALKWGPLDAAGTATLGLDDALQPAGNGTLRLTGYAEAIDALVRSAAISRSQARVAGTLLGLMSRTEPGQPPVVELPLGLHDRLLSTGAIALLKLPPVALP